MSDEQNQSIEETVSSIEKEAVVIAAVLSPKTQQQMEVIKSLFLEGDDRSYGEKIAGAAAKLGKTERTIWRLVKKWRDDGLVGLTQIGRSDKGSSRLVYVRKLNVAILREFSQGDNCFKRLYIN